MLDSNVVALVAAEHPIKTVTVFRSSIAEVTREFTVELQVWISISSITHSNAYAVITALCR